MCVVLPRYRFWNRPDPAPAGSSCSVSGVPLWLDPKGRRRAKRPDQREEVPVGCDSRSNRSRRGRNRLPAQPLRENLRNSLRSCGPSLRQRRFLIAPILLRSSRRFLQGRWSRAVSVELNGLHPLRTRRCPTRERLNWKTSQRSSLRCPSNR
jgi:hypothetical protein